MKKYMKYFKDDILNVILAPTLMLIDSACSVISPYLMSKVIDIGIANSDKDYVIQLGGILCIVAVILLLSGFGCMYFSAKASYGFGANLRQDMLAKIQEFSFMNINKFTTASLITRITNDVQILVNLVQMSLRMLIRAPLMFVGGIIMTFVMNKNMSLIVLALIPFLIMLAFFAIKKAFPLFDKMQQKLDKVNSIIRENLIGSRVIKAFVREDYELNRFKSANKDLRDLSVNSFNILVILLPGVTLIMNIGIAAVLWFGAKMAANGSMEIGKISSCVTYITMTLSSLVMFTMVLMNVSRAKASSDRIQAVLTEDVDIQNNNKGNKCEITKGKIEFDIKEFAFKDSEGDAILKNISFCVEPKETIAIIGATGSGKSTLTHLIPRFYDVNNGSVKIDGVDVRNYDLEVLRSQVGMVLQENRLFAGSIKSNICWGKKEATDDEIWQALKIAQIDTFVRGLDKELDSEVEQRGMNFSGGQKQRLCIARAVIKKPKIIIFDEATSALDATTEQNLNKALRECLNTTNIIVTSRISSCKNADRVVVIDNGTIAGIGTHDELLTTCDIYMEIYDLQKEGAVVDE